MARQTKVQKLEEQLAKMEEQFRKQKEAIEEQKKMLLQKKYESNEEILMRVAKEASRKNLWFPEGSEKDILELLSEYYSDAKEAAKEEKEEKEEKESKPQASLPDAEEPKKPESMKQSELSIPEPF